MFRRYVVVQPHLAVDETFFRHVQPIEVDHEHDIAERGGNSRRLGYREVPEPTLERPTCSSNQQTFREHAGQV